MPISLNDYLNGLVTILQEDYPFQLKRVIYELDDLICLQQLEDETVIIKIEHNEISIKRPKKTDRPNIEVYATKKSFFSIIDGECTLVEAFNNKELEATGSAYNLIKYYNVLESILRLSRASPRFLFLTRQLKS